MDSRMDLQGIDISEKRVEEVIAQSRQLLFVKSGSLNKVLPGFAEYLDLHFRASRIFRFAVSQSTN